MFQNLHQIADHLLTNPPDKRRTFRRNADHHLAAVIPRNRTHDVTKILKSRHQTACRRGGVPHLLRDGGHREDFFLIEKSKKEELRKGNVARGKLFAEMQHETALHFEDNMGKPFRIGTNLIGRISCKYRGRSCIQRA